MKAVGYTRVSTAKQAQEGISLEAQEAKIRAYCDLKDMRLLRIISDTKSGGKTEREGYQEAISLCKAKEVDAVVVFSISRFTRSTKDLFDFVDAFVIKGGIELHSLSESLDTSSPTGRFMLKVMAAMNELEREQIGERTKEALAHKRGKGEKTGGFIPFGYDLHEDGRTLIENGGEQAIIGQIEHWQAEGFSHNAIAKQLNADGYNTKNARRWGREQIGRIIRAGNGRAK